MDKAAKRLTSKSISFRVSAGADIGLTRKTVQTLGNPSFLQFWWCEREKVLFVGSCEEATPESVPVPDYFYHYANGQKIKNHKLRRTLERIMGMKRDDVIRMPGKFFPDINMVAFRLDDAEKGGFQDE
jgi:hypothetical protein